MLLFVPGNALACDLARTADENFKLSWIVEVEAAWQVADLDNGASGFMAMVSMATASMVKASVISMIMITSAAKDSIASTVVKGSAATITA